MKLKGVIFDMDGTVVDVPYDWIQIKTDLETQGEPILVYLNSLEEPEKSIKWKVLEKYEYAATRKAKMKFGMRRFLNLLSKKGAKIALVTNNSRNNVSYLLEKFGLEFDCVISRESGLWKPSGAPILAALKKLGLRKEECCVVGDSHFDIKAASEAGIPHVFILNKDKDIFNKTNAEVFSTVKALKKRVDRLLFKGEIVL